MEENVKEAAEVFGALASEVRLKVIMSLKDGPKTWSELMFGLQVNPKILDESLKKLLKAGVIVKEGNKYRLTGLGDYILQIITPISQLAIEVLVSLLKGFTSKRKKN